MSTLLERWLNVPDLEQIPVRNFEADEWAGDEIVTRFTKEADHIRIAFGNINGLQLSQDNAHRLTDICNEIRLLEIDHLGLAEINVDTENHHVNLLVRETIRKRLNISITQMASSPLATEKFYKPGGTMSIVHDDLVGRAGDRGGDYLGRWSYIKYRGKQNKILTVISAYQVCTRPTNEHGMTAFHQQKLCHIQAGKTNHDPRHNFKQDLLAFLKKCVESNESVIIMGDFNENLAEQEWLLHDPGAPLVDIITTIHPETRSLPTYIRGSTRLDFALATPDIIPSIRKCGYFPFQTHFRSDHRFLYIDLDVVSCLGCENSALCPPTLRDFTSKDPKALRQYLKSFKKYLDDHNFFHPLEELIEQGEEFDSELAERLDSIWVRGSLYAGKKCRRKRRHWFSLPLYTSLEKKAILHTMKSGFKNQRHHEALTASAKRRLKKVGIEMELPISLEDTKKQLTVIQKEIKKIIQDSKGARRTDLELKATEASKNGKKSYAQILDGLIRAEKKVEQWGKIKNVLRTDERSSLASIQVPLSWTSQEAEFLRDEIEDPKKCSEWTTVDVPKEIEQFLRMRNRLHFGQAEGTPFTLPEMKRQFDWAANSVESELVLEGDYSNADLDHIQKRFLEECKRESDEVLSDQITIDEFKSRIKAWDERTTTSPSGVHLGHAKAMTAKIPSTYKDSDELEDIQSTLLHSKVGLMNCGLRNGYSFDRWKVIVNIVMEKDPGNPRIHRLRVIHLYEYDLGAFMAILWQKMMKSSEQRCSINEGQFGGRKGKEARDLAFLEELKVDICLATRKALVNFDNDAASCYDRIIPVLASLIGRSKGLHRNITLVHAKTLSEAKYKLKTALGLSEDDYSHCEAYPIYGTGQGSTNSPIIWIIISSKLFDLHNEMANGATFCSPDGSVEVSFSISGFVDDSNCQTNAFKEEVQPSTEEIAQMAEHDAKLWSELLWMSGGYLELSKCSYHFITFDFKTDGTPVMNGGNVGPPICIEDRQTKLPVEIPRKSVFATHKTLGHYKAPAGKGKAQAEVLKKRADALATKIQASPFNRVEANMVYRAVYLGWVNYVLGQCTLTVKQLKEIETRVSGAFAAKCGFARTMPLSVRYGPTKLGGAGFVKLQTVQGEGQITNFIKHWRIAKSIIGLTGKVALACGQFQAGTSVPLLMHPELQLPHLEQRLMSSMRDFLVTIDAQVEVSPDFIPDLLRQNDFHLMDVVLAAGIFDAKEVKLVNYCRLYLQVTTCAEITAPNGYLLDEGASSGKIHDMASYTRYLKVNQAKPSSAAWKQWRKLTDIVLLSLEMNPLGKWNRGAPALRRVWKSYVDLQTSLLYHCENGQYFEFIRISEGCFSHKSECEITWQPTNTCVPVSASSGPGDTMWVEEESICKIKVMDLVATAETFEEYISQLPDWERLLFEEWEFVEGDPYQLIQICELTAASEDMVLQIVGDGSAGEGSMSFGWVLALVDGKLIARGAGPAFGHFESSYRGEGYAFLAGVRFLYRWFKFCGVNPQWNIKYIADNESILGAVLKDLKYNNPWPNSTLDADWDLRYEIKRTIQLLQGKLTIEHVKGHQDDNKEIDELSIPAQLNVQADELAGDFRVRFNNRRPMVPRLGSNTAQLHIAGKTIPGHYRREIRFAAGANELRSKIREKYQWSQSTFDLIDWNAHGAALSSMNASQTSLTKLLFEWMPTNTRLKKYNPRLSANCPWCKCEPETINHTVRCHHKVSKEWRIRVLGNLQRKCNHSLLSCPDLVTALTAGLKAWFAGEVLDINSLPSTVRKLARDQNTVGWDQLLRGRFVISWATIQDRYLHTLVNSDAKKRSVGKLWVASIAKVYWTHFFEHWERRNKFVHGDDSKTIRTADKKKLLKELRFIHSDPNQYLNAHRVELITLTADEDDKLEAFVDKSQTYVIKNWLAWHRPFFRQSAKVAKSTSLESVSPLTNYFQPVHRLVRRAVRQVTRHQTPTPTVTRPNHRIEKYFSVRCPQVRMPNELSL